MNTTAFTPLSKQDVAAILGVSIRTVENFVARGRMPAPAHIGARVLWHPDVFYAWLDQALRSGGWSDDSDGACRDEKRTEKAVTPALAPSKPGKVAHAHSKVASRLQARQARILSTVGPA
ncbi:helix-turn-helix transcriptional regulator [Paraburkholderia lycopersici]|uniref:helix-turn-helix transcriptional regulator n=1 Tax=Paraburkholderia lycopersici TaxID=416944 RepID=UPI000B24ED29|nr:helix-turn-helix domain-containing protein [Paraburkholderia lycopersici]